MTPEPMNLEGLTPEQAQTVTALWNQVVELEQRVQKLVTPRWRFRAHVETTSKAVPSFNVTVEGEGATEEEVLEKLDFFNRELWARCHPDVPFALGSQRDQKVDHIREALN